MAVPSHPGPVDDTEENNSTGKRCHFLPLLGPPGREGRGAVGSSVCTIPSRHPRVTLLLYVYSSEETAITACLRLALARKVTIRHGRIVTSSPVLGFRPFLAALLRTVNTPKLDTLIDSPSSRVVLNSSTIQFSSLAAASSEIAVS